MKTATKRLATVTCKTCAFFHPKECGYVASDGKKDKGGNRTNINFNMRHNCHDWQPKAETGS